MPSLKVRRLTACFVACWTESHRLPSRLEMWAYMLGFADDRLDDILRPYEAV